MYNELKTTELFSYPEHTVAWEYLSGFLYPWQALDGLKEYILSLGERLPEGRYDSPERGVYIAKSAKIAKGA